jgi:hypothetical protein
MKTKADKKEHMKWERVWDMFADEFNEERSPEDPSCTHDDYP